MIGSNVDSSRLWNSESLPGAGTTESSHVPTRLPRCPGYLYMRLDPLFSVEAWAHDMDRYGTPSPSYLRAHPTIINQHTFPWSYSLIATTFAHLLHLPRAWKQNDTIRRDYVCYPVCEACSNVPAKLHAVLKPTHICASLYNPKLLAEPR